MQWVAKLLLQRAVSRGKKSERRLGDNFVTQLHFLCGLGQIIFLCLNFLNKGKSYLQEGGGLDILMKVMRGGRYPQSSILVVASC